MEITVFMAAEPKASGPDAPSLAAHAPAMLLPRGAGHRFYTSVIARHTGHDEFLFHNVSDRKSTFSARNQIGLCAATIDLYGDVIDEVLRSRQWQSNSSV
jgi:hypothetical protein